MKTINYFGYEIKHVAKSDWVISKDNVPCLNSKFLIGNNDYPRNAFTLKEAKARIDNMLLNGSVK